MHIVNHRHGRGPRGVRAMRGMGRHGWGERMAHRGGGGRRRIFDAGELKLVLLRLLSDQPRHGYDLIREIEQRSGGAYAPSPGVIYPTLTLLQDMGHIDEQTAEGARKQFGISPAGEQYLAGQRAEADALLERLAKLGEEHARTEGGPIRRAMLNLRSVLQDTLSVGNVEGDRLHDVAAIIDEASQKIERLK